MGEIIDRLIQQYLFDLSTLSQAWMYWFVIPALLYIPFMILKWAVLTLPAWLPFAIVISIWKD